MNCLKNYFVWAIVCSLMFTSCTKEEQIGNNGELDNARLSFEAILNDMATNRAVTKNSLADLPECTDDVPAYVNIILSLNGTEVVGTAEQPFKINLVTNQNYTGEVPELELPPGNYTLEYFAVYNEAEELIWLAPKGGIFATYFENPLPMDIDLRAGVKKYVEVEVLCFDERMVNDYGYLFFELQPNRAVQFCLFGNYCDSTGRHYPAAFSVNVWSYANDIQGNLLYSNVSNTVELDENGDYSGTTVCLALPDTAGVDEYYFEISLLNSNAYGSIQESVIRSGIITDEDIRSLFVGEDRVEYYHFRAGCTGQDTPNLFQENGGGETPCNLNDPEADCDGDGVPNGIDNCPGTPLGIAVDEFGCESVSVPGRDIVVFNDLNIFDDYALRDQDNVQLVKNLVNFTTTGSRNEGNKVWMDRGRNSVCGGDGFCSDAAISLMRSTITGEGFVIENVNSNSGSITTIPADVKTIFLWLPSIQYTVEEINTFKAFAAAGGRIVFIGEWDRYYNNIPLQNQFLLNMGAVLHNTGGALDCGLGTTLPESSNREHPIMLGVGSLSVACASVIETGPNDFALFYDSSNTHVLAGVAKIDTTPINALRTGEILNSPQKPSLSSKGLNTKTPTGL